MTQKAFQEIGRENLLHFLAACEKLLCGNIFISKIYIFVLIFFFHLNFLPFFIAIFSHHIFFCMKQAVFAVSRFLLETIKSIEDLIY